MRETGNFNSKQIVKSRWFHNWAAPRPNTWCYSRIGSIVNSELHWYRRVSISWAAVQVIHLNTREQCGGSSEAPENLSRISWATWYVLSLTNFHPAIYCNSCPGEWRVQSGAILNHCCHNLHNCPAGCWARNAAVIVPKLAEIGDNYEFVNQFRPLWSAGPAQDVKFCDEKTERPFLSQRAGIKRDGGLIARQSWLSINVERDPHIDWRKITQQFIKCTHFSSLIWETKYLVK